MRLYIEYLGDSIELSRGETLVGRDVGCAFRFNDPSVSRRHLRFIRRVVNEEAFVEDLASSNGTLLNGRRISAPMRIHDGDVISVGSRMLTVRVVGDDDMDASSTLIIKEGELARSAGARVRIEESLDHSRARTRQIANVTPPLLANQRCPSCAAPVSDLDDTCSTCGHRWRGFRPSTPTTKSVPLSKSGEFGEFNPLDRRRHDRHSLELRLIYVSSELEIEATTRDLSHSGVFVRTQILDPVGTTCELTILLDGGPPLHVSGVVRRVVQTSDHGEPIGLGVELSHLGKSERDWIDLVLARTA